MLSQRWVFKNAKYKNLGVNLYKKKVVRLIGESAFLVLNYVIWLIRNTVKNLCSVCLSRKILSQKEGKERKGKRKIESIKIMIYVENIN